MVWKVRFNLYFSPYKLSRINQDKFLNSEVRKVIKDAAYFKYTHAQVTLYITTQYAYYLEKVFCTLNNTIFLIFPKCVSQNSYFGIYIGIGTRKQDSSSTRRAIPYLILPTKELSVHLLNQKQLCLRAHRKKSRFQTIQYLKLSIIIC